MIVNRDVCTVQVDRRARLCNPACLCTHVVPITDCLVTAKSLAISDIELGCVEDQEGGVLSQVVSSL